MKEGSLLKELSFLLLALVFVVGGDLFALEQPASELNEVGVDAPLGADIDLSLQFTDSFGKTAALGDFLKPGAPTILVPAYYACPRLCGLLLNGVANLTSALKLQLGQEYRIVTVSFDSTETPAQAEKRRIAHQPGAGVTDPADWPFLVGSTENVAALMQQIGFRFRRDGEEYAHTAALILLTPQGRISQYFTGVSFPAWDVRLGLIDASQGGIGSAFDHVLLFCFRFDPTKGRYTWAVVNLLRAGGTLTIILLGGLLWKLFRRERRSARAATR